nr:radical SAM family heme chaperone HemW [Saprospiraceae bacterium]
MAGIYIHIPFCRKACTYCNFHFSTNLDRKAEFLSALWREIDLRDSFLTDKKIDTVYFGGGTPSVLNPGELEAVFQKLDEHYDLSHAAEITLEANPDDLDETYIRQLTDSRINRLSIGIQSFNDRVLKWMNRSHESAQAHRAIEWSLKYGFEQLTIDLIYGVPGRPTAEFAAELERINEYGIPHFSAYALTVEPKTLLAHRIKKGLEKPPAAEETVDQFEFLMNWAPSSGYEQYEISNFARPGFRAQHNSSYWNGVPYLGLGPSAHSFDGKNRYWNISNNALYCRELIAGSTSLEMEKLTPLNIFNEYIMTGLRLAEGIQREKALNLLPGAAKNFDHTSAEMLRSGWIAIEDGQHIKLTQKGKLVADYVASEYMEVD